MDEPDMGPDAGAQPGGPSAETGTTTDEATAADWAAQRRAEARALLAAPEEHFTTPSWLDRGTATPVPRVSPVVPAQVEPVHDDLHAFAPVPAPVPATESIPESARWVERRRPRLVVGILLTLSLLAALGCLVVAIVTQETAALVGLAVFGVLVVIFRATLMSTGVTTTELKGPILKVRMNGDLHVFKLDDPDHLVRVEGQPGASGWKVVLESPAGKIIELDASHVDAEQMHPIAEHYRSVAERERDQKRYRFNL